MAASTEILFDPSDPGLRRDPYPIYRRTREEAPVWRSPEGVHYFSRYRDCFELFRSPALSYDVTASKHFASTLADDPEERERQLTAMRRSKTILDIDPPEHTRLRSLINRAFTAPVVEANRPRVVEIVDGLMDDFDGPTVDIVSSFANMLPILVICGMLGIPAEERHSFLELADATARAVDPDVPLAEKLASGQRSRAYITGLVERRRQQPGDDLITRLIEAADDGRLADQDELISNTGALLSAGFETTTNLITNAVYRLIEFPDQLARLLADPSLIRTAIEEVLRFDPPTHMIRPRTIIAETEIGGTRLHPGDAVVPMLAAANRDPEEFPGAETFDIGRTVNRHMTFGLGHHLCIGAALARLEAQTAVLRLFQRFPHLALSPDHEPEYRPNLTLRGFSKLYVVT